MSLDIILFCGSGLKKYKFALNAFNALIDTVIDSIICHTEKPISKKHIEWRFIITAYLCYYENKE